MTDLAEAPTGLDDQQGAMVAEAAISDTPLDRAEGFVEAALEAGDEAPQAEPAPVAELGVVDISEAPQTNAEPVMPSVEENQETEVSMEELETARDRARDNVQRLAQESVAAWSELDAAEENYANAQRNRSTERIQAAVAAQATESAEPAPVPEEPTAAPVAETPAETPPPVIRRFAAPIAAAQQGQPTPDMLRVVEPVPATVATDIDEHLAQEQPVAADPIEHGRDAGL